MAAFYPPTPPVHYSILQRNIRRGYRLTHEVRGIEQAGR